MIWIVNTRWSTPTYPDRMENHVPWAVGFILAHFYLHFAEKRVEETIEKPSLLKEQILRCDFLNERVDWWTLTVSQTPEGFMVGKICGF